MKAKYKMELESSTIGSYTEHEKMNLTITEGGVFVCSLEISFDQPANESMSCGISIKVPEFSNHTPGSFDLEIISKAVAFILDESNRRYGENNDDVELYPGIFRDFETGDDLGPLTFFTVE